MRKHLAIMSKPVAEAVLAGKKSIETRFSKNRIAPFGVVSGGDLVYIKLPGEDVIGQFRVKKVFSFEGLTPDDFDLIIKEYGKNISSGQKDEDQKYFQEKRSCCFGTLIFIADSERFITSPIKFKKSDQRGWMVLED